MQSIIAALILAIALVAAAILSGGIYTMRVIKNSVGSDYVYRLNRLTGSLDFCGIGSAGLNCIRYPETHPAPTPQKERVIRGGEWRGKAEARSIPAKGIRVDLSVGTIVGLLKEALGLVRDFFRRRSVPKKSLVVLPDSVWWSKAGTADKPAMMVVGDFHFTNVHTGTTSVPKTILVVRRRRDLWLRRLRYEGQHGVQGQNTTLNSRFAPIPPNKTTTGRVMWFIQPPIVQPNKPLRARAIFVDRFGNEHWTAPAHLRATLRRYSPRHADGIP